MPFYKRENEELIVAPNFVHAPGFSLNAENYAEHEYPVDGWYWFDSLDAALAYFAANSVNAPLRCHRRQAELALLEIGKLDAVEAAISAIADPIAKRRAQIEYGADVWERSNPFLQGMWAALGGTEAQLDDLFRLAATL